MSKSLSKASLEKLPNAQSLLQSDTKSRKSMVTESQVQRSSSTSYAQSVLNENISSDLNKILIQARKSRENLLSVLMQIDQEHT